MYVIFMGAQGSGKGTQAERIGPKLKLVKVATGDLFRTAIAQQSELGLQVQSIIEAGDFVPDELTNAIVQVRLAQIAASRENSDEVEGALFDGFPRNGAQALVLDEILSSQGTRLDAVVEIDVPRDKLIDRLSGRRTCENCGAVYHIEAGPPQVDGICDKCGGRLIQRDDDKPESIARRLALYDDQTKPLLDYYREKGILVTVNGDQDIDLVTADIIQALGQ